MEQEPKHKQVTPEMRLRLRAPLPAEAVKQNPSKTFLSTIKPIFVTERLNEVFGIGAWQIRTDIVSPVASELKKNPKTGREYNEFTALMKTVLTIPEYGIYYECIAGSTNEDEGDSTKGGTTDGITKIASWLEIGINVFKGLGNVASEPSIEEGVTAILNAKSREDIDKAWKLYPHLRSVEAFKNAAKAMSALYPATEQKEAAQPKQEPKQEPVKWAMEKQKELIRNLVKSHHITDAYRQELQYIESNYEGEFPLPEFERVFAELQELIKQGLEYEKNTPATPELIEEIQIHWDKPYFTQEERKKGLDSLNKGYSIAKARATIATLEEKIAERSKLKVS